MDRTKKQMIDDFRNIIVPKTADRLLKLDYEGMGQQDKEDYLREANMILDLAEKGLEAEERGNEA